MSGEFVTTDFVDVIGRIIRNQSEHAILAMGAEVGWGS